jgi:hypothetical protein
MIMSGPHSFELSSGINKYIRKNILSPSTLHAYFIHGSHLVCYSPIKSLHHFYVSHGRFFDRIESCWEGSYTTKFPMNCHCNMFDIVGRIFHVLIFPTFSLFLLQVLLLFFFYEHVFASLELHRWLHWNYEFTSSSLFILYNVG